MRTATAYTGGWIHAILLAAALGCGGGGGDAPAARAVEFIDQAPTRADDGSCVIGGPREWAAGEACRVFTWGTTLVSGDEA